MRQTIKDVLFVVLLAAIWVCAVDAMSWALDVVWWKAIVIAFTASFIDDLLGMVRGD